MLTTAEKAAYVDRIAGAITLARIKDPAGDLVYEASITFQAADSNGHAYPTADIQFTSTTAGMYRLLLTDAGTEVVIHDFEVSSADAGAEIILDNLHINLDGGEVGFTDYAAGLALDTTAAWPDEVSLHNGDPGSDGSNEVTDTNYARESVGTWTYESGTAGRLFSGNLAYDVDATTSVDYVGIWLSGTFLGYGTLPETASGAVDLHSTEIVLEILATVYNDTIAGLSSDIYAGSALRGNALSLYTDYPVDSQSEDYNHYSRSTLLGDRRYVILFASFNDVDNRIHVVDIETNTRAWEDHYTQDRDDDINVDWNMGNPGEMVWFVNSDIIVNSVEDGTRLVEGTVGNDCFFITIDGSGYIYINRFYYDGSTSFRLIRKHDRDVGFADGDELWTFTMYDSTTDGDRPHDLAVVNGEVVVIYSPTSGNDLGVLFLDPSDGSEKRRIEVASTPTSDNPQDYKHAYDHPSGQLVLVNPGTINAYRVFDSTSQVWKLDEDDSLPRTLLGATYNPATDRLDCVEQDGGTDEVYIVERDITDGTEISTDVSPGIPSSDGIDRSLTNALIGHAQAPVVQPVNGDVLVTTTGGDVIRLDYEGNTLWTFSGFGDHVRAVALQPDGHAYAGDDDNIGDDGYIRKIDPSGTEVWATLVGARNVNVIAVDDAAVYVGTSDGLLRKYGTDGSFLWSISVYDDYVTGIEVDSSGYLYSCGGATDDRVDKRNASDGSLVWQVSASNTFLGVGPSPVVVDPNQNVYVGTDEGIHKLDADGNEIWSRYDGDAVEVNCDQYGNLLVAWGDRFSTFSKYDSDGNLLWDKVTSDNVFDVGFDPDGKVYIVTRDDYVRRFDARGNQVWEVGIANELWHMDVAPGRVGMFHEYWPS